jgi:arylsulfatase A-like enzyme
VTETPSSPKTFVHLLPVCAAWTAVGLLDGLVGALVAGGLGAIDVLATCLTSAGLWLILGVLVWAALSAIPLLVGRSTLRRWISAWRSAWRAAMDEGEGSRDRERMATIAGWIAGVLVWLGLGAAALAYLIATRHGPWLIALTSLILHVALVPLGVVAGAAARRLVASSLGAVSKREPYGELLRARRVVTLMTILASVGGLLGVSAFWSLFIATDALAFLLPLVALALTPFAHKHAPNRGGFIAMIVVLAVATTAVCLGLQSRSARSAVARHAPTSKYLMNRLQALADGDGDGAPRPPFGDDCAPDDPTIHPFALDIPGDGIDQDCDGVDATKASADASTFTPLERPAPLDPRAVKPHLVLVTIDALRADHLGAYGYARPTSPTFDRYAAQGVLFEEAFAQDSGTGPSLWSLMVGKTPFQVELERADRFPPRYGPSETTFATRLQNSGYKTAAVLCGQVFATPWWNLKDGFERFEEVCGAKDRHQAPRVTARAVKTWKELSTQGPVALWVHYYDPHAPYYNNPRVDFGTTAIDRYDEEIAFTDQHLRPLLDALTTPGDRPTYVAITADHGEAFGEHGPDPHARTLYREVTRVPLLFLGPDVAKGKVAEPVAVHDIAATFLDLAGIAIPEEMTARSLGRVLFGEPAPAARIVYQENSYSRPRRDAKAVIRGAYHFILDLTNGTRELYDMEKDPREMNNLAGQELPVEAELEAALRAFLPTTRVPSNLSK